MPHSISTPTSPSLNCPPASLPLHTLHPTRLLRQPPPSGLYIAHSTNLATSPRTTPASSAIAAAVAAALEAALQQAHMDRAAGLTHPNHLLRKLPTHASDDNKTTLLPTPPQSRHPDMDRALTPPTQPLYYDTPTLANIDMWLPPPPAPPTPMPPQTDSAGSYTHSPTHTRTEQTYQSIQSPTPIDQPTDLPHPCPTTPCVQLPPPPTAGHMSHTLRTTHPPTPRGVLH